MSVENQASPGADASPLRVLRHGEILKEIGNAGTSQYPLGRDRSLVFASAEDEQRWKENTSEDGVDKHETEADATRVFKVATGIACLVLLLLTAGFLLESIFEGKLLQHWWKIILSAVLLVGGLRVFSAACDEEQEGEAAGWENNPHFTYRVFNLNHPMFPKDNPLAGCGTTIFNLRNKQAMIGDKQGSEKELGTSSTPLDTGESTYRMLKEYEQYLDMAGKFAKLWPDADQSTRDAMAGDMDAKAKTLRTVCATYQTDAQQVAKINREKRNYLDQQEAETNSIISHAKAVEASDKYKRIRTQYDL